MRRMYICRKILYYFKFSFTNKMPVLLTPFKSQSYEPRRMKTTNKMVEDALIEVHNAKGITLNKMYKFILNNYNIDKLSNVRIGLIKKHIVKLRESGDIVNKTGRGLSGHFKLVDKLKFIKKIKTNKKPVNLNVTRNLNHDGNGKNQTKILKTHKTTTKFPREVSLHNNNESMFDTPMLPTQVQASTPLKSGVIPGAPEIKRMSQRVNSAQDDLSTPRSSLPEKKRQLLKRKKKKL